MSAYILIANNQLDKARRYLSLMVENLTDGNGDVEEPELVETVTKLRTMLEDLDQIEGALDKALKALDKKA